MEKDQATRWRALQGNKQKRNNSNLNEEQVSRWKRQHGSKGISFYTIGLWLILIISLANGFSIGASATSAIHQIYGGISFIIATLMFCALAIRSKISEEAESIVSSIETLSATVLEEDKDE